MAPVPTQSYQNVVDSRYRLPAVRSQPVGRLQDCAQTTIAFWKARHVNSGRCAVSDVEFPQV